MKLAPAQKELLDTELPTIRVKVQGARIEISAHLGTLSLTAKDVVQAKDGTISATVVAPNGVQQRITIQRLGEGRLKLTSKDARFGGTAILVR